MHKLSGALLITEASCADKRIPRDAAADGRKGYETFQSCTSHLLDLKCVVAPCHEVPWALQAATCKPRIWPYGLKITPLLYYDASRKQESSTNQDLGSREWILLHFQCLSSSFLWQLAHLWSPQWSICCGCCSWLRWDQWICLQPLA